MTDEEYKPFLISYRHEGSEWSLIIMAQSESDVRARMGRISLGRVDGIVQATYPVGLGWWGKLVCWWRNEESAYLSGTG